MVDITEDTPPAPKTSEASYRASGFNVPSKDSILEFFKTGHRREPHRMPFYWNAIRHHNFITHELTGLLFPIAEGKFSRLPKVQAAINRPDFFHTWFDKLYSANTPSPLSFIKIFSSFDQMGMKPEQAFMDMLSNEIDFEKLSSRGLNDFIVATARLNLPIENDILKKWIFALGRKLEDYKNPDIAMTVWSLAIIDAGIRNPELRDVAKILLDHYDFTDIGPHESSQLNIATLWFQIPEYRTQPYNTHESQSGLEINIRKAFARAGNDIFPEEKHFIPALNRYVDIRMMANDRHVVVEVDGPRHFIRNLETNEFEFNGSTTVMTGVLGRLIPDTIIVRANYNHREELINILGTDASDEFARHITDEFSRVGPGLYKTELAQGKVCLTPFFNPESLPDYLPPAKPEKPSWVSRAYHALKGLNPFG